MRFISSVLDRLGMEPRFVFSSTLGATTTKTELLADLLGSVGAELYLCGQGAREYQDDAVFAQRGIRLAYNEFQHPTYEQRRSQPFTPGLSILDPLFSVPLSEIRSWLEVSREAFRRKSEARAS
jgi:hypothetical protein